MVRSVGSDLAKVTALKVLAMGFGACRGKRFLPTILVDLLIVAHYRVNPLQPLRKWLV